MEENKVTNMCPYHEIEMIRDDEGEWCDVCDREMRDIAMEDMTK